MTYSKFRLLALPLVAAGCFADADSNDSATRAELQRGETVTLADGVVHGSSADGTRTFIGIPYAAAPTGVLRFRPPQPVRPWRGTLHATGAGVSCIQPADGSDLGVPQEEDCLALNVFAPEHPKNPAPVLVWLHGGDNVRGSANELQPGANTRRYDGAALRAAAAEEVVVVTLNYRLGTLGFLAHPTLTEEEGMSGNYGLMDQRAALRWVQRNVKAFGGDPERVTLVGQGAGATDVCVQMIAPSDEALFHAAVLESGTCGVRDISLLSAAQTRGVNQARELGCESDDPTTQLDCLRAAPAEQLASGLASPLVDTLVIADGVFMPEQPRAALGAGRFARVPVIVGSNAREGSYFVRDDGALATEDDYRSWIASMFGDERADAIKAAYALREDVAYPQIITRDLLLDALAEQIVTDAFFTCPAQQVSGALSRRTHVYRYTFTSSAYIEPYAGLGATHGVETLWLWNAWHHAESSSTPDRELATRIIGYWSQVSDGRSVHPGYPRCGAAVGRPGAPVDTTRRTRATPPRRASDVPINNRVMWFTVLVGQS